MNWRTTKRRLALAICALALLGGGTAVAIAATSSPSGHGRHRHSGPHGLVTTAAGYLGVSPRQLRCELRAGRTLGEIADATPGRSEAGLVATILAARKARLQVLQAQMPARVAALVSQSRTHRRQRAHPVRRAILAYLGLGARQLQAELRTGKTLAQIADSTGGRSSSGLVSAILSARRARIEQAVGSGAVTRHAGAIRASKLPSRVRAQISRRRTGAPGASSSAPASR